jgi:hypothetical protein
MDLAQIKKRAEIILSITQDYLMDIDNSHFEIGEAYKYGYLVLRGPKNYLNAFKEGSLFLDLESVRSIIAKFYEEMPDKYPDLNSSEIKVIEQHNQEVATFLKKEERTRPRLGLL